MRVRRVVIELSGRDRERIVAYPEGGVHLEQHIEGFGWCLNNGATDDDADMLPELTAARQILDGIASKLAV